MAIIEPHSKPHENVCYLGVDVQIRRPCTYYLLDQHLGYLDSGNLAGSTMDETSQHLCALVLSLQAHGAREMAVGIDAPRMGLPTLRRWVWRAGGWGPKTSRDRGYGRHCEVAVKALGLGNPQWTRPAGDSPPWMGLGYCLFESLEGLAETHEVFPSASYHMLQELEHPPIALCLKGFAGQVKDMLDACTAAYTMWALCNGRGTEVGGRDGLGTIALPEKLAVSVSHPVLHWPENLV
jgi:hypothetical protein